MTRKLFIFFHGYGANGDNVSSITNYWHRHFPHGIFKHPDGPLVLDAEHNMHAWFPIEEMEPSILLKAVEESAPQIESYVRNLQAYYVCAPKDTILAGFSQGGMLALYLSLTAKNPLSNTAISYSGGFIAPQSHIIQKDIAILNIFGEKDLVVPINYYDKTIATLSHLPCVENHLLPDLDHSIDSRGLILGTHFLKKIFRNP